MTSSPWYFTVSGNGDLTLSRNNQEVGAQKLLIYPIPASDLINIRFLVEDMDVVSIKLLDINSRVVYGLKEVTETLIEIPTINLEKGVYFVAIELTDSTLVRKITLN